MLTIAQMMNVLEKQGFEVLKRWDAETDSYSFSIYRDGIGATSVYKWQPDLGREQVTTYQAHFIREIIDLWRMERDRRLGRKGTYPYITKTEEFIEYCKADVMNTQEAMYRMMQSRTNHPSIKDVIFNNPATIVFWSDGTKTVVKCQEGDTYDPEKGLAMAIAKKFFGNKGNYCNEINKWMDKYYADNLESTMNDIRKALNNIKISIPTLNFTTTPKTISPKFTAYDKLLAAHPDAIDSDGGVSLWCPSDFGYLSDPDNCCWGIDCKTCWNREMPAEDKTNKE